MCDLCCRDFLKTDFLLKQRRYSFHQPSVSFLGFIIEEGQIRVDPGKVQAVAEWPTPQLQLQHFLGFANFYCRFIKVFSLVVVPLTPLTSTKVRLDGGGGTGVPPT